MGTFFIKQLHTLDTFSFSFAELNKEWGCDKRYSMDALQRFLFINQRALDYLDVSAEIEVVGNDPYLKLRTSQFAGSVPMMSPKDGKPCGDLCVGGRFGEDISELLSVVGDSLLPEYNDVLPPLSSSMLEPPLYFECCNFIDKWLEVEKARWHKFDVVERIERIPASGTRWDVYAMNSYNPSKAFHYPNRTNKLKPLHKEFCQMLSILQICFKELKKPQTPMRSRIAYANKMERLSAKYDVSFAEQPPMEFMEHASDPMAIKDAKRIANIILQNKRTQKRAWRIDYSEFFERYVQYVFGEVAKSSAAKTICNPRYSVSGDRPVWALHYLEPDLVLQKGDTQFILDAKYKSHMFNQNGAGEELKDIFRHDLHQILAYCSFNSMTTKKAMLVYPYSGFSYRKLRIKSPLADSDAQIYLVGIPLNKINIEETKDKISLLINQ
ncbi:MAG: hypothetical protein Q4A15_06475 [Prevotellaceae bacterium]|nr:hypothetical protein [Prevotellaceae bacterium]